MIVAPSEFYIGKLHDAVKLLVIAPHPETDWLPMMRLLRNKSAHFEQPLFRQWGIPRVSDGRISFHSREWACFWLFLFENAGPAPESSCVNRFLETSFVGICDVPGPVLLAKVKAVIGAASTVLNETYDQFKDLPPNQPALAELKNNFEKCSFENFA